MGVGRIRKRALICVMYPESGVGGEAISASRLSLSREATRGALGNTLRCNLLSTNRFVYNLYRHPSDRFVTMLRLIAILKPIMSQCP